MRKYFLQTIIMLLVVFNGLSIGGNQALAASGVSLSQFKALEKKVSSLTEKIKELEIADYAASTNLSYIKGDIQSVTNRLDFLGSGASSKAKEVLKSSEKYVFQVSCGGSLGSGFGISIRLSPEALAKGYSGALITNHHVVQYCLGLDVKVSQNGRNLGGHVYDWDEENDLALILTIGSIEGVPLSTKAPERGDLVVALGSPYGLEGSVSTGIVSNLYGDFVTTDAAVDPGNSGGPLLNAEGQLVGVNTWGFSESQGNNFAIKPGVICRQILICPTDSEYLSWSK